MPSDSATYDAAAWVERLRQAAADHVTRPHIFSTTDADDTELLRLQKCIAAWLSDKDVARTAASEVHRDVFEEDADWTLPPEPPVSAAAAVGLKAAFRALRDACVRCPANQCTLRNTTLWLEALRFALDGASALDARDDGGEDAAPLPQRQEIERAIVSALQFAHNFAVGSPENQAALWKAAFPGLLMDLVHRHRRRRAVLAPVLALLYCCCTLQPSGAGGGDDEEGDGGDGDDGNGDDSDGKGNTSEGNDAGGGGGGFNSESGGNSHGSACGAYRLGELASHRAFCCMLMQVAVTQPPKPKERPAQPTTPTPPSLSSSSSLVDPAMDWLHLLCCRFVAAGLQGLVYDGLGMGSAAEAPIATAVTATVALVAGEEALNGNVDAADRGDAAPPDVTPEQLIFLQMMEAVAADEMVCGESGGDGGSGGGGGSDNCREADNDSGERAAAAACLGRWLVCMLAAMPPDQRLPVAPAASAAPARTAPAAPVGTGSASAAAAAAAAAREERAVVRRSMQEEGRTWALRALGTVLGVCAAAARRDVAERTPLVRLCAALLAGAGGALPASRASKAAAASATAATAAASSVRGNGDVDASREALAVGISSPHLAAAAARESVPAAAAVAAAAESRATANGTARSATAAPAGNGGATAATAAAEPEAAAPAGRKSDVVRVLANLCFRCQPAQEAVRTLDALPLVLGQCGLDVANPMLREWALLAVRNLCEGNEENQRAIAVLRPAPLVLRGDRDGAVVVAPP